MLANARTGTSGVHTHRGGPGDGVGVRWRLGHRLALPGEGRSAGLGDSALPRGRAPHCDGAVVRPALAELAALGSPVRVSARAMAGALEGVAMRPSSGEGALPR